MNERAIFDAALEIRDLAQRRVYLDQSCAGNPELRARVEGLLNSHAAVGSFLNVPVVDQLQPGHPWPLDRTTDFSHDAGTQDDSDPDHDGQIALGFLKPSTKPGSLGTLAHYDIVQVLGQGSFGIVLKAFDEKLHRLVAIKVMNPELAVTSPPRKRFLREARAAAAIRHENVVQVYSVDEQPLPYLVMEYIDGQTLQQKLDGSGPLDIPEVLHLGRQIASGLAAAHAMGLIHRDIKPGNILLEQGPEQKVKITDFGLARAADDASMTRTGVVSGTPMYMAPEQALGQPLDLRADLFSFGSVLYQMACGRPPFRASSTVAVLRRVAEDTPRPLQEILPEIPDWLVAIVAKLHAKNPEDRFQSAKELVDLLARCQSELQHLGRVESLSDVLPMIPKAAKAINDSVHGVFPVSEEKPSPIPKGRTSLPRRRRWVAAAAVLGVLLAGLGLTEATGVTNVRSTVIRLFSPDGTLVVEVDDPDLSVTIDGEEMVITGSGAKEIRLKPGQYKVLASKDGTLVCQELVTVTRNGRQVLRVSKEVARVPVIADRDRRAAKDVPLVRGNWRIVGDVIEHPDKNESAMLLFGSPEFGDGDFTCEAMRAEGDHGLALVARATDLENYYYFDIGVFHNSYHSIYSKEAGSNWRRIDQQQAPPVPTDRWVNMRLRLRGDSFEGYLDDQIVVSGKDDRRLQGYIGLRTWNDAGKYRNLKFTDPNGKVLWQGLPDVSVPSLRRDQITPEALKMAGDGDPNRAPASLVGVLGEAAPTHTGVVSGVAFSPDGSWLASGSHDKTILLRDVGTGKVQRTLQGHTGPVSAVAFSKDSRTVISASHDGTLKLWPTDKESEPLTLQAKLGLILSMAVSADDRFVAAAGLNGGVHLWKWGQWNTPLEIVPEDQKGWSKLPYPTACLAFSPDGELLAVGLAEDKPDDHSIHIYKTTNGKETLALTDGGKEKRRPESITFSRDGQYLACHVPKVKVGVWEVSSGKHIAEFPANHQWGSVTFSPDSQKIVVGMCYRIELYDLASQAKEQVLYAGHGVCNSGAFSPDGNLFAGGFMSGGIVHVWDTATWKEKYLEHGHLQHVRALAISPDGSKVLSAGNDGTLRQWDLARSGTNQIVHPFIADDFYAGSEPPGSALVSYSPDGKMFVLLVRGVGYYSFHDERAMIAWDTDTLKQRWTVPLKADLDSIAFSPDGKTIAGGDSDGSVRLWDAALGTEVHRFPVRGRCAAVTFSGDGKLLAAASWDKNFVKVWNVASGAEVHSWQDTSMTAAVFRRDGQVLATGHKDGMISLWELAEGKKKRTLSGHSAQVQSLKFTPDSKTLVSSGHDGTIRVWNPEWERAQQVIPLGPANQRLVMDLDRSGKYLVAAGQSPLIFLLRLQKDQVEP